jgi:DNA-binding CsgD family transcriptional regulator
MAKTEYILETINAAYDLVLNDYDWIRHIAKPILQALGSNNGNGSFYYFDAYNNNPTIKLWNWTHLNEPKESLKLYSHMEASPMTKDMLCSSPLVGSSSGLGMIPRVGKFYDIMGLTTIEPSAGLGLCFHFGTKVPIDHSAQLKRAFKLLSMHLASVLRLRRKLALADSQVIDLFEGADAILDVRKRFLHAENSTKSIKYQDKLRQAAIIIDKAKSAYGKKWPDQAMEAWTALISGRWNIIDHFDTDGKHFYIVRENNLYFRPFFSLTEAEIKVAAQAASGLPNKMIAYALGISITAVGVHMHRIYLKTGIRSRSHLIQLIRQQIHKQKSGQLKAQNPIEKLKVFSIATKVVKDFNKLSPAEKDIVHAILAGKNNMEIALQRKTSKYTIINQIATLFKKIKVGSRNELIIKFTKNQ